MSVSFLSKKISFLKGLHHYTSSSFCLKHMLNSHVDEGELHDRYQGRIDPKYSISYCWVT